MIRRLLRILGLVALLLGIVGGAVLVHGHLQIRSIGGPLPPFEAIDSLLEKVTDAPVRLSWILTASQEMPRSSVLGGTDPHPREPYTLGHTAFVLEWSNGRILLIDSGMTREGTIAFGRLAESTGAQSIRVHGTVVEALDDRVDRLSGVVFTHLHTDHVGGLSEICDRRPEGSVEIAMSDAQAGRGNYTTWGGLRTVEKASCGRIVSIGSGPLLPLASFPGVYVVPAGGHTPGSQIVVAVVDEGASRQLFVFVGDIVNNADGLEHDIAKPFLYRYLVVPEDEERMGTLRRWLRNLRERTGARLLVSHDELSLLSSGVVRDGN